MFLIWQHIIKTKQRVLHKFFYKPKLWFYYYIKYYYIVKMVTLILTYMKIIFETQFLDYLLNYKKNSFVIFSYFLDQAVNNLSNKISQGMFCRSTRFFGEFCCLVKNHRTNPIKKARPALDFVIVLVWWFFLQDWEAIIQFKPV